MPVKTKNSYKFVKEIAPRENLERRFYFIEDEVLRKNIAIAFEYIVFLISLIDKQKLRRLMASAVNKDMIIYTAAIIESCLHYCLRKFIELEMVESSEVMPWEWREEVCKELYKTNDGREVCGIVRYKRITKLTSNTNFIEINRACKKTKILTKDLFKRSEKLRGQRNKIHLSGLKEIDNYYTKRDVNTQFNTAKRIIERIENKMNKLGNN